MADADPTLAETMATLQRRIDALDKEIREANEDMMKDGMKTYDRLTTLKPLQDEKVKLQEKENKLQEKENILLQLQLRAQGGSFFPSSSADLCKVCNELGVVLVPCCAPIPPCLAACLVSTPESGILTVSSQRPLCRSTTTTTRCLRFVHSHYSVISPHTCPHRALAVPRI